MAIHLKQQQDAFCSPRMLSFEGCSFDITEATLTADMEATYKQASHDGETAAGRLVVVVMVELVVVPWPGLLISCLLAGWLPAVCGHLAAPDGRDGHQAQRRRWVLLFLGRRRHGRRPGPGYGC